MSAPMSSGLGDTHQRVHVGAVEIEQGAALMQRIGDVADFGLEDPSVLGLVTIRAATSSSSRRRISAASRKPRAFDARDHHLESGQRRAGRVGAVGGIGDDHLARLRAAFAMIGARDQQAGQLALRAGRRMERHRVHPGDFGQRRARAAPSVRARPGQMRRRARMERAKPGSAAISSLSTGLYFIVHEPSG